MNLNREIVKARLRPIRAMMFVQTTDMRIIHLGINGGLTVGRRWGRGRSSGVIVDLDLRTSTSAGFLI